MKRVLIYADGSSNGKSGAIGGWGVLVETPEETIEFGAAVPNATNNIVEILACFGALTWVFENQRAATIHLDSEYVLKGTTEWMHKWNKFGWKTYSGAPVKNRDLWEQMLGLYPKVSPLVEFKHIPGHSKTLGDNPADRVAKYFKQMGVFETTVMVTKKDAAAVQLELPISIS